jgi:hypothetical protein
LLVEVLFAVLAAILEEAISDDEQSHRGMAAIGHLLMGAAAGAVSLLVFRFPLVAHPPIRGASLLLAPILTGGVLELLGRWWVRRGNVRMALFTFRGGFAFALGMALVRFVYIHL